MIPLVAVNRFGLTARQMQTIYTILNKYPAVCSVVVFGSRAKGTFSTGSDIDLAIMDKQLTDETLRQIKSDFEESTLPYFVDLVCYSILQNPALKDHIERVGIPLLRGGTPVGF